MVSPEQMYERVESLNPLVPGFELSVGDHTRDCPKNTACQGICFT